MGFLQNFVAWHGECNYDPTAAHPTLETTMKISTTILRSATPILLAAMALDGLGCMVDPSEWPSEEERIAEARQGSAGDPGTMNHLKKICFEDYRFHRTARNLANSRIANASGDMPSMPYMTSPWETGDYAGCRRAVLDVMVGCALDGNDTIRDTSDSFVLWGNTIYKTYSGEVGIAPDWMTRALTTTEREYVTGCMLERINLYGATVEILPWGSGNAALTANIPYTITSYTYEDSAAWGNLFDSTASLSYSVTGQGGPPAFTSYLCQHNGEVCPSGDAMLRQCDSVSGYCGMTYTGSCDGVSLLCASSPSTPLCAGFSRRVNASLDLDGACD
jgi:hypothetical protein